jgi:ADP-dependent NAD(P)H-hydrate dehydratase / NAD(P)H-hydrate epimerase
MKVVTASEMQNIDRITIQEMGLPGEVLMGLAGKAVADHIRNECPWVKRAAVFSGTGNNGGDGFVAAYFLTQYGLQADVFLAGDEGRISETSRVYYNLCKKSGICISAAGAAGSIDLDRYDCIVDAILGTGSAGTVRGTAAEAIRAINDSDAFVVAVDIPSGLGSDGAAPEGEAVMADSTVTIGLPKISLVTYPGSEYAGTLHVADIGFPRSLTESPSLTCELIDAEFFLNSAVREIESEFSSGPDVHKGARGQLLIIGGFDGMEGAAMLAASAAFETGVGLVTLLTTGTARTAVAGKIPELMTMSLPADAADVEQSIRTILEAKQWDALILGPGLGRTDFSRLVAETTIKAVPACGIKRVLIDGDGLFHLAGYLKKEKLDKGVAWLVTPHFLEASRLIGLSVDEIKSNRLNAASVLSARHSCSALLKGPGTIVTGGGHQFINTTGNAALATAGSGDVLSGIIGAMLLRKLPAVHAAACGAWLHGRAADLYSSEHASTVMKSSDILPYIRAAKNQM